MSVLSSIEKNIISKERFPKIDILDFRSYSIYEAHFRLGIDVRYQVHQYLTKKISLWTKQQYKEKLHIANSVLVSLEQRLSNTSIDKIIRGAILDYLNCLDMWSKGLLLSEFIKDILSTHYDIGNEISPLILALVLQNDMTGCQTGMYRHIDRSISLWHTEEDTEDVTGVRFDKLRIMKYRVNDIEICSFIYPDLMPGPAYSWRSDYYVQAVDAIYIKESIVRDGILANIVCWIKLILGSSISSDILLSQLNPLIDGYSLNTIYCEKNQIYGNKIDFISDIYELTELEKKPGSYKFQCNILSDEDTPLSNFYENKASNTRKYFKRRIYRTDRFITTSPPSTKISYFVKLISTRVGGDYAYANEEVKSFFICNLDDSKLNIFVGIGPALKNEEPHLLFEY